MLVSAFHDRDLVLRILGFERDDRARNEVTACQGHGANHGDAADIAAQIVDLDACLRHFHDRQPDAASERFGITGCPHAETGVLEQRNSQRSLQTSSRTMQRGLSDLACMSSASEAAVRYERRQCVELRMRQAESQLIDVGNGPAVATQQLRQTLADLHRGPFYAGGAQCACRGRPHARTVACE